MNNMKTKRYFILSSISFGVICIVISIFLLYKKLYNMDNLPAGDYLKSLDSPNHNYTLNAYRYSGGATMDWTLRVEVVNNKDGNCRNIYWNYHESEANMKWLSNEIVKINNKKLNVKMDKYDYRYDFSKD